MPCRLRMARRMALRRIVTAVRAAAFLAGAQVDPLRADLHALVALVVARRFHSSKGREVDAFPIDHRRTVAPSRAGCYHINI